MKICYGILSSSTNGAIVGQLARTLGEDSTVLIHHDYSQKPDFQLDSDLNVTVLRDHVRTEWGRWSQAEAIIRLLESAMDSSFDYFQLLSETCLPIRPLCEFDAFLEMERPDACMGLIPLLGRANDRGTLNYARRYFTTSPISRRILGRLARACLDRRGIESPRARELSQGLSVINANSKATSVTTDSLLLNAALKLAELGHPFSRDFRCHVGSTWFCLSRPVVEHVIDRLRSTPRLTRYFRETLSPDESIIHTVVGNSQFKKILPINHFISWTERENGPDSLKSEHLPLFADSGRFFARKFPTDVSHPIRLNVISALAAAERLK